MQINKYDKNGHICLKKWKSIFSLVLYIPDSTYIDKNSGDENNLKTLL